MARDNPQRLPQLRAYWQKASWTLALALRAGASFAQATEDIMKDSSAKYDALSKYMPDEKQKWDNKGKGKKGKDSLRSAESKGKGKELLNGPAPYPLQTRGPPACRLFLQGRCRFGDQCKFAHVASPAAPDTFPPAVPGSHPGSA